MAIDTKTIKELRRISGAPVAGCRQALEEAKGNMDKAVVLLRKRGQKVALAKQTRMATEGRIGEYVHSNGKIAALVELACETDFVARNKEFTELAHDLAMQVAAADPKYLSPQDIPAEVLKKEKEIYREKIKSAGGEKKPKEVIERIIEGKVKKFYSEVCLISQPFIKDDKLTIQELLTQKIARIGENIQIKRFIRFAL